MKIKYNGEATTTVPPNIPSFDLMKRDPALHTMCHFATAPAATPAATPVSTTDISSLTSMLLLQTVQDLTHEATPLTPVLYAKDHLGVAFASTYEASLCGIGIGPNILVDMADQDLAQVGLSAGDIIWLKKGSVTWPAEHKILHYNLYYFCKNRKSWVIFPPGFTFKSEGDHADAEDPFI
ncbi:uncharacterized protein BJ212DRAFT_1480274 [Suillus subaureus]|uniref:Uncharacterized protein n=1 Tax=Suillus subaureus TaxID=48587 RepID=A0A9P7JEE3_9AGAM|nr:uncharacterized protein BJ212DRAFT_1480274 [Suillus subaureus]KAG1817731.1 hypothetical protein BJ212DRAFT_1480274 [Suillus subaureus]